MSTRRTKTTHRPGRNRPYRAHRAPHRHIWDTYRPPTGEIANHCCRCGAVVRLQLDRCADHNHLDARVEHMGEYGVWPDQLLDLVDSFRHEVGL
jgi:hypothetical protein